MEGLSSYRRRFLEDRLREALEFFPSITILGPRQSGKTTLVRKALRSTPTSIWKIPKTGPLPGKIPGDF